MKKLSLVLTLFIAVATTVNAQDQKAGTAKGTATEKAEVKPAEAIAKKQTEELDKLVSLSDAQKQDIYNMNLTLAHRSEIIRTGGGADKEKTLAGIEEFRVNTLMQKLNDEQAAKYKAATRK
jgi:hypothetical protein